MQCSKRFRGKINIQRPRPAFYERALVEAATKPYYDRVPLVEECREMQEAKRLPRTEKFVRPMHPYEQILAKELFERLNTAKMILFCHTNSYTSAGIFDTQVQMYRLNVHMKTYGQKLLRGATEGTKFESIIPLFGAPTCIIYSTENQVAKTLKILKKARALIVLAGIVEDRFLSSNQLIEYSNLPSLDIVRARFAADLYSSGNSVVSNLQSHQNNLCYMLDAHAKILGEKNTNSDNTSDSETNNGIVDAPTTWFICTSLLPIPFDSPYINKY